jgi:hypothetical protein
MVVGGFYVVGVAALEAETDAVLVVDPDSLLTLSVSTQSMEPVSGRHLQLLDAIDLIELRRL